MNTTDASPARPIEILLVEDNPGDVRLLAETLKEVPIATHLNVVDDGTAALAFLRRNAPHADAPRPDLILLDLDLPALDGRELLRLIKADSNLECIPIFVLSSSQSIDDVHRTFALHIKNFIAKPVDTTQLCDILQSVQDFWLNAQKPPLHVPHHQGTQTLH
jgi:CheY-like chemotaxis protein